MSPLLKIVLMMMMSSPVMAGPNSRATVTLDGNVESTPKSHFVENINLFIFVNYCFC